MMRRVASILTLALCCWGLCTLALTAPAAAAEVATEAPAVANASATPAVDGAIAVDAEATAVVPVAEVDLFAPEPTFMSFFDCDSPPGTCTSNGQCWAYCQALVCEIGICSPIAGCCVCPEGSGC